MKPLHGGRIAVAASVAIVAVFAVASLGRESGESPETKMLFATAFLPIYWIAAGIAWWASRSPELDYRGRRAWELIALAHVAPAVNNGLFFASRHLGGFAGQDVLITLVLPGVWYALMFAALAQLVRSMESGLERATFWLDAATVLFSGLVILRYVFAHIPGESSIASPIAALTTIAIPALNGAVIFAAIVVILRPAQGVSRPAIAFLALGVAITLVTDLAYGRAAAVGAHHGGIWYEPLYLMAACVAVVSAQAQLELPGDARARQFDVVSTRSSLLPYAAVVAAVTAVILEIRGQWGTPLGTMVVGAVMLTGLVMSRQLISRRHVAELALAEQARLANQAALELKLQQAQKLEAVGLLAGGIAHDFNNILAAIRGTAELASTSPETLREDMDDIVRAVDHGTALTRQLLAFGRRDAIQLQRFDLRELVQSMDAMLRRVVTGQVLLRVTVPAHPVTVEMDRGQVEQVLLNLAINARDAMPAGGTLSIDVATITRGPDEATYATLMIADTGHGMPPEVVARMFEPFYSTKPRGRGSGLGLSTVYAIVTRAGGSINVSSAVGKGTTLEVLLPLVEAQDAAEAQASPASTLTPPEPSSGREVILVVDDEASIRDLVARYLSRNGYAVHVAADAAEALGWLSAPEHGIDLLLTDLTMPGMSGRALIEQARVIDPDLRVICMSGYAEPATTPDESSVPQSNYIEKPFAMDALGRLVRSALDAPARR